MFTKIGRILPETVHKNGIAPQLRRTATLEAFADEASARLPEELLGDFRPLHVRGRTLCVACRSAAAARHIKACEAEILEALASLGADPIERISTILAPWR